MGRKIPKEFSSIPAIESQKKTVDEVIGTEKKPTGQLILDTDPNKEIMEIGGVPEEHREVNVKFSRARKNI